MLGIIWDALWIAVPAWAGWKGHKMVYGPKTDPSQKAIR